jgi:TRAP-type C4-dicarboxylate transport system substrate-binding protein
MNSKLLGGKTMKPWTLTLSALAIAAASALPATAETIKIAMNGAEDLETNSEYAFVVAFRDALEGSGMEVQVFPSDALGSEKERLGQTAQGLIHMNLAAATSPASISPMLRGLIMPFMFRSAEEFDEVIASTDLLDKMNAPLIDNGLRLVAFTQRGLDAGIFNSKKPVATLEDLASLRMRALNKGQVAFFQVMGVSSTVVAWGEVANALQTNIVDGYVNAPNSALRTGHTQYLKHYTPAALAPSLRAVLVSEDWYADMSDDDRAKVEAAIAAGVAANRAWVIDWGKQVDAKFAEAGVTVTELANGERDKMRELAVAVHKQVLGDEALADYTTAIGQVRK